MKNNWNLNDIYKGFDSAEFQADFESLRPTVEKMNNLASKLKSFDDVVVLVKLLEEYNAKVDRMGSYSNFVFTTNTADQNATKYLYLIESLDAETSRTQVRLAAFLSNAAKTQCLTTLAKEHGLEHYTYWLTHMTEEYNHLLNEDEETIIALMSSTGSSAWRMMQEKLISNLTCEYDGKTININDCRNLAYSSDASVRKAAYEAELASYPKIDEAVASALNSIKGEVNLLTHLRRFENPLEQTLFDAGMSKKTLDAMFDAIEKNIQCFRDYLKAKARYLNKPNGLPFYDLFAPVGKSAGNSLSYEEAKTFVAENFGKFSAGMEKVAHLAFDNEWVDIYPKEGKVSGAYCGDIYQIKQFRILLNYGNNLSDAITLAHELGHGYHSMQVMEEGILNSNYPMPLAETASTFCEAIVTTAALKSLPNEERLQLIENSLQDSTQVIVDIYSRFLFEKKVFDARLSHPLSVDELKGIMLTAQKDAYGDGLDHNALHPYMWLIKPHYYSANVSYYNFPYAFGHLLANGLYKIYEKDPNSFGKKYDSFLRASGKMPITESCKLLGVDVESVEFWNDAIDVIKNNIKAFEGLISQ